MMQWLARRNADDLNATKATVEEEGLLPVNFTIFNSSICVQLSWLIYLFVIYFYLCVQVVVLLFYMLQRSCQICPTPILIRR